MNVHPAKLEVKFSNEKPVFEAIYYAVRNALEENRTRPDFSLPSSKTSAAFTRVSDMKVPIVDSRAESLSKRQIGAELFVKSGGQGASSSPDKFVRMTAEEYARQYVGATKDTTLEKLAQKAEQTSSAAEPKKEEKKEPSQRGEPIAQPMSAVEKATRQVESERANDIPAHKTVEEPKIELPSKDTERPQTTAEAMPLPESEPASENRSSLSYRIVGELFNSYVVVELLDKMLLIDKHAAHERVIFEQLKAGMRSLAPVSQLLMIPLEIMMTSDEVAAISEYRAEIEAVGFEFDCGRNTITVSAVPEGVSLEAISDMLTVIAERIKSNTGTAILTRDIIFEKALYQASCKAAIKAGREYPPEYVSWLVSKLMEIPDITFCPHGRPVAMELTKKKIDHQFERC